MMQVIKISDKEQMKIYMKLPKKRLAEMLMNCNKIIDQITPIVRIGAEVYSKLNIPKDSK